MAEFSVPPPSQPYNEREFLRIFLKSVEELLQETLREEPGLFIPAELHQFAVAAFETVRRKLGDMERALQGVSEEALSEHELEGAQLVYKLALIDYQNRRFNAARRQRRPARGIFRKLLECIDIPLKSLIEALRLGGLVAEFKEAVEKGVPEDFGEIQ